MTGRKTERGQGGEEQRAVGADRRCPSLINHRDGDPHPHQPHSTLQATERQKPRKVAPNRGHSPRAWDARGQAEPLLDAEETWGTGWTRSWKEPGTPRGFQGVGPEAKRLWDTPTRAGFRVRTVR